MRRVVIVAMALVAILGVAIVILIARQPAVIDGFESYDDRKNRIFDTWIDGFANDTGSNVGYFEAPFAEQKVVHTGEQSLHCITTTRPRLSTQRPRGPGGAPRIGRLTMPTP